MQKDGERIMDDTVRLATVTGVGKDGQATVTFYGDSGPSGKKYPYIRNYIPVQGDTAILLKQGDTYIIMGAAITGELILQFALAGHDHEGVYAEEEHTHSELANGEHGVQVSQSGALIPKKDCTLGTEAKAFAAVYGENIIALSKVTIGGTDVTEELLEKLQKQTVLYSDTYENRKVTFEKDALLPNENAGVSLGSSVRKYKEGHFNTVYIGGTAVNATFLTGLQNPSAMQSSTSSARKISFTGATLVPDSNGVVSIGTSGLRYKEGHFETIYVDGTAVTAELINALQTPSSLKSSTVSARKVNFTGSEILPDTTGAISLGNSLREYKAGYFDNVYINGTAASTSDKRAKKYIKNLPAKFVSFFMLLRPVIYKYKKGTSGRFHTGFIAQEVEAAMREADITSEEFAGLVIGENGKYGLRYGEFIAIQTKMIQDLYRKVDLLERKVKELESGNKHPAECKPGKSRTNRS